MTNRSPNLILGGSSYQTDGFNEKASVTTYSSDPCQEVNLTESDIYSSLRYPDVKLTRLENDENCLKYLSSARKKEHLKALFYNSDNVSSVESDSSFDDIDSTESSVSDHENLSCNQFRKNSEVDEDYCEIIETNWNPHKNPLSRFFKSKVKNQKRILKFPVIKLIRLENDKNCYKYLKKTPAVEMHETKVDKEKLSCIRIAPSPDIHGEPEELATTMTVAQYDDQLNASEESKDSCIETSINDSDCSQNSVNSTKAKLISKKSLSLSGNTPPSEVDLITLDWTSSEEEDSTPSSLGSKIFGSTNTQQTPLSPMSKILNNSDSQSGCDEVNHYSNQCEIGIIDEDLENLQSKRRCENSDFQSVCDEINQNSNQSEIGINDEAPENLPPEKRCENTDSQSSCDEVNHNSNQSRISIIDEAPKKSLPERRCMERNSVHDLSIVIPIESNNLKLNGDIGVNVATLADIDDDSSVNDEYFIIDFEFVNDDDFECLLSNAGKSEDSKPIQATCELCNDSFSTRSSLYNHMEQIHKYPNVYECAHCGQLFSVKACLVYHLYAQLEDENEDIDKAHICPQYLCSRENFTQVELEFLKSLCLNHFTLHNQLPQLQTFDASQNVAVSNCDSNLNDVITEEKQHLDEIQIETTSVNQSPTESYANIHLEKALNVPSIENCNPKIFKRKIGVEDSDQNSKKPKSLSTFIDQNSCNSCLESFSNRKELFNHLISGHNHIYYHECHLCAKLFHNSISFASHLIKKECHKMDKRSRKKPFCEFCKGTYKSGTILRKHKMNIHNLYIPSVHNDFIQFLISRNLNNTVFNCIFCYESHSCLSSLRDHEESLHSFYSCFKPWCPLSFSSRSDLERHLFLHFSQGESSFCEFCSQLFFTKAILERHIERHLEERNSNKST